MTSKDSAARLLPLTLNFEQRNSSFAAGAGGDLRNEQGAVIMKTSIATIAAILLAFPAAAQTATSGHITGLGGVFVTSKNPKALAAWYRDVLGIPLEPWGGAILRYDAAGHPPMALWNAMSRDSAEIRPTHREFMINFAVDDLDAFVRRLKAKGVAILKRQQDETGKFASIVDPDGTKIELWQPPAA